MITICVIIVLFAAISFPESHFNGIVLDDFLLADVIFFPDYVTLAEERTHNLN